MNTRVAVGFGEYMHVLQISHSYLHPPPDVLQMRSVTLAQKVASDWYNRRRNIQQNAPTVIYRPIKIPTQPATANHIQQQHSAASAAMLIGRAAAVADAAGL